MNILITNDDGIESFGLTILREVARKCYKNANLFTVVSHRPMSGHGSAVSMKPLDDFEPEKQGDERLWVMRARPADIIHFCLQNGDRLAPGTVFDGVLCGVNLGANVGADVYHSGTVAQAMTASTQYNVGAFAFAQEMPTTEPGDEKEDRKHFEGSVKYLEDFVRSTSFQPGECWNVNFPEGEPKGYEEAPVSHYSYWRTPSIEQLPRAKDERSDITLLKRGFVTISELQLRVNPTVRF